MAAWTIRRTVLCSLHQRVGVHPFCFITANVQIKTLTKPLSNQLRAKAVQPGWFRECCLRTVDFITIWRVGPFFGWRAIKRNR
jgi:hypothetical protein